MDGMTETPHTGRDARWSVPFVAAALFACAMLLLVWGLQEREAALEGNALARDARWAEQTMRLHLAGNREFLAQLVHDHADGTLDAPEFQLRASQHMANNPELVGIAFIDAGESVRWAAPFETTEWIVGNVLADGVRADFQQSRDSRRPAYGRPRLDGGGAHIVDFYMPAQRGGRWSGTFVATYSVPGMLAHLVPNWLGEKYRLAMTAADGSLLAENATARGRDEIATAIPIAEGDSGLTLHASANLTESTLPRQIAAVLILGLSMVLLGSLWSLRRHALRRQQVERERDRLFNLSLDILCISDLGGEFRRVNPAFRRVLGHAEAEVIGQSLTRFVHWDDLVMTQNALSRLGEGLPVSFENRCRCADGRFKWLVWNINPAQEDRMLYAVAHDITDRKNAEEALRTESAFRKAMEESVLTGLRAIDLTGQIIYVNPAFCQMVGRRPEELVGARAPFPYWPEADREIMQHNLDLTLSGQAPKGGFEVRVERADGGCVDVRLYVSPLIDSAGRQTGWMAAMHDITEPKRARAELEAAHERFVAVLDGLDTAVYVVDAASDAILYANRAFTLVFGEDAVGANCWERTARCHPGAGALQVDPHRLNLAELPRELFDGAVCDHPSGRWYHVRDRAIKWVDGRVVRMVVATDFTERRQIDEENLRQQTRLEQTSRLITMGEMASSLAHELNQPLAAIANYCSGSVKRIESGTGTPADLLGALHKASQQAERAGKIIRRVRDFVKKSEPQRTCCDFREIADEAMAFADIAARSNATRLLADIDATLPPVFADRIMIEQVMLNLLKNAIEAMQTVPAEQRCVIVRAHLDAEERIEVEVIDRGCGIAAETAEQLFSPFYTTKKEGMGMGLNICRTIIELHQGQLAVTPNPDGGSIFRFTLPSAEA
jgi:PAS domain S-box-containing protein